VKDRWITLLLALGALAAFYFYFVGPKESEAENHSRPLATEMRANGYFAIRRWLETEGIPVTELRQRYDWLARARGLPRHGNLLITTIPHKRVMRLAEEKALKKWLRSGNTLLVVAGIFDTPEWGVPDFSSPTELYQLTGLSLDTHDDAETEGGEAGAGKTAPAAGAPQDSQAGPAANVFVPLEKPKRGILKPIGDHPYTRGVLAVHAISEYEAGKFDLSSSEHEPALSLMADSESGLGAFWVTWIGGGTVIVSGYGSIFTNKMLAQANNADLVANIVAAQLGRRGHVIFDDMHQGATSVYDADAFFGDPRLHASFWWIIALWFVWVLGSTRLPPPAARPPPVRERGFIDATGNFFARVIGKRGAARRLFANFFNDCRRALGEPPDGRPRWAWIRGFGAITREDIDRLEALYARVEEGKRVNLVDLHNRLQHIRKQLA
jgi:hypothetical protein